MNIEDCKVKVIVDTREKKINSHILSKFDEGFEEKPSMHARKIGTKSKYTEPIQYYKQEKGLKIGDFTICVQLPNGEQINFQDKIIIERKANLNEVCGNLVDSKSNDDRKINRFARELEKANEKGIKVIVLIEESDGFSKALNGVFRHDVLSKMNPKSFISKLYSLKHRYDFEIVYIDKKDSARYIYTELYMYAREYLKEIE